MRKIIKRHDGTHIIEGEDKRKVDALAMSTRGVSADLSEGDKEIFDGIKELQKEFQEKNCKNCKEYDLVKNDFKEKGHVNDPKDCKYHWSDILGNCWNYKVRG
jgi:hypothetical protein